MSDDIAERLHALLAAGTLDLAVPAAGATPSRLQALHELASVESLSVARLAEAHTDAVAILHEAGGRAEPGKLYGVWASQDPTSGVDLDQTSGRLTGTMGFASGLGIVDRALVTARTDSGSVLVDVSVSLDHSNIQATTSAWGSPALVDTATGPVTFHGLTVDEDDVIGERGWYLSRAGFWQGACAPAACWAGGAQGLIDAAGQYVGDDPHRQAHHGALVGHAWTLRSVLDAAGRQIDEAPGDRVVAERVARCLRFAVSTVCRDVMDRFGRAFGPRPYVSDASIAQRSIDLDLYLKQHHAERELPQLSMLVDVAPE